MEKNHFIIEAISLRAYRRVWVYCF